MSEEETQAHTSMSPEYALELRVKALEERIQQDQARDKEELLQRLTDDVEKRLAQRWRTAASTFGRIR